MRMRRAAGDKAASAGPYHGYVRSRVFHQASCRYYECQNCTAGFDSRERAVAAGYLPSLPMACTCRRSVVKTRWPLYLSASEIEKEFLLAAIHLKQIVVLDGIERGVEPPGFRICSHDLHGPLPEVVVRDTGDRTAILEEISREAAKLNAIARHREE